MTDHHFSAIVYSAINALELSDGTWLIEAIDECDGGIESARFAGYKARKNAEAYVRAIYGPTRIPLNLHL